MAIRLVGELLSPISCPMANVTIHLKALDTSASVLFSSEASVKTDYKGRYEFTVPTGLYLVSLDNGISSAELGQIQVYSDSAESTLQALLDAPKTEPSPIWLQQLEEKVAEATKQAGIATNAATEATTAAKTVKDNVDAAKQHADRAYASATNAAKSEASASADAVSAEESAVRAEEAAAISQSIGVVNPNLFINGCFSVNQRGENSGWLADRWTFGSNGLTDSLTHRTVRLLDHENDRLVASHAGELLKDANTTYNFVTITQRIENFTPFIDNTVTVSGVLRVYDKGAYQTDTIKNYFERIQVRLSAGKGFVGGGSSPSSEWDFRADVNDNRYIHFSTTLTLPYVADLITHAEVLIWLSSANKTWTALNVTNMKCEEGGTATPNVPDLPSVNLAKCQRYFWKPDSSFYRQSGIAYNGNLIHISPTTFPTTMRDAPSVKIVSPPHVTTKGNWAVYNTQDPTQWSGTGCQVDSTTTKSTVTFGLKSVAGIVNNESYLIEGSFEVDAEI